MNKVKNIARNSYGYIKPENAKNNINTQVFWVPKSIKKHKGY